MNLFWHARFNFTQVKYGFNGRYWAFCEIFLYVQIIILFNFLSAFIYRTLSLCYQIFVIFVLSQNPSVVLLHHCPANNHNSNQPNSNNSPKIHFRRRNEISWTNRNSMRKKKFKIHILNIFIINYYFDANIWKWENMRKF